MPDLGDALPLKDPLGRRGVEVELHPIHHPEVVVKGDKPQALGRSFDDAAELALGRALFQNCLRL